MFKLKGKQQEILYLPQNGHGVVCGVAGSGKSVCAVMRAKYIQSLTDGRVLLLTYNNSLINYMKDIHSDLLNIDITTYHKFATKCMRGAKILGYNEILSTDWEKEALIKRAMNNVKIKSPNTTVLNRSITFFIEEIQWMQGFGVLNEKDYENVERSGRKSARLLKSDRKYVFQVYEEYIKLRKQAGKKYDWDDCAYYLNQYLKNNNIYREYESIIIDEGQDFTPMMIQSLVNYMGQDGSILYLGDQAQQIYGKGRMSWKQLGLKIRKAHTLDENHRNTKQIEKLANSIRTTLELDIVDGLVSMNSVKEGEKPTIASFYTENDEDTYIIEKIKNYSKKGSTCIIVKKDDIKHYESILRMNRISFTTIDRDVKDISRNKGIFISNYHAIKGLEFDNVIMARCSSDMFKKNLQNLNDEEKREKEIELAKIIYVGISRARENLTITHCGELLNIIPKDDSICNFYIGE